MKDGYTNNYQLSNKNSFNQDSMVDLQGFQESIEKEEIKEFRIKRNDIKGNNKKNNIVESSRLKTNKLIDVKFVKPFTIKKKEKNNTGILSNKKIGSNINELRTENTSKSNSKQSFISQRLVNIKEEYTSKRASPKRPSIDLIHQRLLMEEMKFNKLLSDKSSILERMGFEKKIQFVSNENKLLRAEFKELNELFSILVENQKMNSLKIKKKPQFNRIVIEFDSNLQELSNMNKILNNLEIEYNQLNERLSEISNRDFMHKLIKLNEKLEEGIKAKRKKNVILAASQKKLEFRAIQEMKFHFQKQDQENNQLHKEQSFDIFDIFNINEIDSKLNKLNQKREKLDILKSNQAKLISEQENQMKDLILTAKEYKIDPESLQLNSVHLLQMAKLETSKMMNNKSIDSIKNKLKMITFEYNSRIHSLEKSISEEQKTINNLNKFDK